MLLVVTDESGPGRHSVTGHDMLSKTNLAFSTKLPVLWQSTFAV